MTFLEKLTTDILSKHKNELSDLCVIFPSRRAGIYFKNILSKQLESPIWSPSVFSIEDFIGKLSPYNIIDNLTLIFELYRVYEEVKMDEHIRLANITNEDIDIDDTETFDSFYQWGQMLLKDFDSVDKFLVDTNLIFRNIKNLREIEEKFPLELQEDFKKFWGSVFTYQESAIKKNFIKIWQIIGDVYLKYKEVLSSQNLAYEGMAARKFCEDLISGKLNSKWKKFIFAGFNSLNKCEEKIIKYLLDKNIAEIYWDADKYYVEDKKQEAGKFIRRNFKKFGIESNLFFKDESFNNLEKDVKNINVIGSPLSVGMTKAFGSELNEFIKNNDFSPEKTAVILPDENLLLPVLYSIPDSVDEINVTMGYPFADTPLYSFISLLKQLQENIKYDKSGYSFHHEDIEKILMHPYVKFNDTGIVYEILNEIKHKNIVYIGFVFLLKHKNIPRILKVVLKPVKNVNEAYKYLTEILNIILEKTGSDNSKNSNYKNFQLEYIYNLSENLNLLSGVLEKYKIVIDVSTFWKILIEILNAVSIPFTGEPLKGLQIMGLLESRSLDFDNVFILSMNEGILPKGNSQNSFIPYSLRKAVGLPTFEDNDALSAYYFYRILQRAKNIFLFYDTEVSVNTKEKSRYILQIKNELIKKNLNITYSHKVVIPAVQTYKVEPIEIEKKDNIIEKIKYINHLSPSDLINYINCPLKFYFKKIEKLDEPEEVEEYFSPATFGSMLHYIMKLLYDDYKGKELNENNFINVINKFENEFNEIYIKSLISVYGGNFDYDSSGKNILLKKVIHRLIRQVLENDKVNLPFKIIDLECSLYGELNLNNGTKIKLKGKIDRIDVKDNITRIIDYKTGTVKIKKLTEKNTDFYFDDMLENPDYKESFQGYFYAHLYKKLNPESNVIVGIYPMKKFKEGIMLINDEFITEETYTEFENHLIELINEIYDPSKKFTQTDDLKRCEYCPYKDICKR